MKYILVILMSFFAITSQAQFLKKIDLSMGTNLPTELGARVKYNFNSNFYGELGLGYLPDFYAGLMENFLLGLSDGENEIMKETIGNSTVLNIGAGYRFRGPYYISGSYTYMTGGAGQATGAQMNNFLYDIAAPWPHPDPINEDEAYDIETNISALSIKAGMEYKVNPKFTLGIEAGLVKPISAGNKVRNQYTNPLILHDMEKFLEQSWKDSIILTIGVWAQLKL